MSGGRYDYRRRRMGIREEEMSSGSFGDASIDDFVVEDYVEGEEEVAGPHDNSPSSSGLKEEAGSGGAQLEGRSGSRGRRRRRSSATLVIISSNEEGESDTGCGCGQGEGEVAAPANARAGGPGPPRRDTRDGETASPAPNTEAEEKGDGDEDEPLLHTGAASKRTRWREAQQSEAWKISKRVLISESSDASGGSNDGCSDGGLRKRSRAPRLELVRAPLRDAL